MNVPATLREYIKKMLADTPGMKVLVVDQETLAITSVLYSKSEILAKEVMLVEMLDAPAQMGEPLLHLKAVVFVRPGSETISLLRKQLKNPKYGEYNLFFSNTIKDGSLQELAEADEHEVVKQVQEYFADFLAVDASHFTLDVPASPWCFVPLARDAAASGRLCDRIVEGLGAALLSLKKRPLVRYQRSSELARRVGQDLYRLAYQQEAGLFDFRRAETAPLLLLVDRLDDPLTPLLSQWTYQAMVHELLGIKANTVDLSHVDKLPADQRSVPLSADADAFFRTNMYENYGDLGANVKAMVDEFQGLHQSTASVSSIEDMLRFVENYPEFRAKSGTVARHVSLLGEMSRLIAERELMAIAQVEQELATASGAFDSSSAALESIMGFVHNPKIAPDDKLRLVLLFALRYEKEAGRMLGQLAESLSQSGVPPARVSLVSTLLKLAGADRRTGDLYGTGNIFKRATNMARGLKGVDNVYTQHTPLLKGTIEAAAKGVLSDADYPYIGTLPPTGGPFRPQDIIVFVVGGTTYEEAKAVAELNAKGPIRVLFGGTSIQNSATFLADLLEAQQQIFN